MKIRSTLPFFGHLFFCAIFSTFCILSLPTANAQANEEVVGALSARHLEVTHQQLEELAGGRDVLIQSLLEIRRTARVPAASIRAQKFLLHYADEEEVTEALLDDIDSEEFHGLARTIVLHIDKIPSSTARRTIARRALQRARTDSGLRPYTQTLIESKDEEVRAAAREITATPDAE